MNALSAGKLLPTTEQLLVQGGDERIALGEGGLANRYGCTPFPDEDVLSFGSSTASVISGAGFAAADQLRDRLLDGLSLEPDCVTYSRELDRVRGELSRLCGVADVPGLEIVLAASGTELHLIAAQLCGGAENLPALVVMVEPAETGSGVAAALAGGQGNDGCEVATVPIRLADGTPRPLHEVDAEFAALAGQAAEEGRNVLLVLVDQSKTGLIAPTPACVAALQERWQGELEVLVDACQFRIAPATLRAYLERGFMLALTGSKFVGGPSFSGALFIPASPASRLRVRPLTSILRARATREEWPRDWKPARRLSRGANYGLLLRWEAALHELRTFRSVADEDIADFLQRFARAVQTRLSGDPVFEPLTAFEFDRRPLVEAWAWDQVPTIFPFLLRRSDKTPLTREETAQVHGMLRIDMADHGSANFRRSDRDVAALRVHLGQPVACGSRRGGSVSALRLCASARLVVEAASRGESGLSDAIGQALAALDKTALLADFTTSSRGQTRMERLRRLQAA